MTQQEFQAKLAEVLAQAQAQGNAIRREEVNAAFEGEPLSAEQLTLVYDYLLAKKIRVTGYVKQKDPSGAEQALTEKDRRALEAYRAELGQLEPERAEERRTLLFRLAQGGTDGKQRLTELFLPDVAELALELYAPELALMDLIQEGNLSLMLALEQLSAGAGLSEDPETQLLQEIRQGMQALAEEQKEMHQEDRHMVRQVEELKDSVAVLKEEMGRKVYLDEVADFMNISEEQATAILKLAGEDVPEEEAE